jgi:hypothetical protein
MRTTGTFQDVYKAAKHYYNGDKWGDCPSNPVVRRDNGRWMLESGLEPAQDADFEVTLEVFDSWHYEAYQGTDYMPSQFDIDDFVAAYTEEV